MSNISVLSLPLSAQDLSNPHWYTGITRSIPTTADQGTDQQQSMAQQPGHNITLLAASRLGHYRAARAAVVWGADVDARDDLGDTPLTCAASHGHHMIVEFLLDSGAAIEIHGASGLTALLGAITHGHEKTVGLLLGRGANIEAEGGQDTNPGSQSTLAGHQTAEPALGFDLTAELIPNMGYTPLQSAVIRGQREIALLLLAGGADTEATNRVKFTPLQLAARHGHGELVQLMLEWGAKTDVTSIAEDIPKIVPNLPENDAKAEPDVDWQYSPQQLATRSGHHEIARFLKNYHENRAVRFEGERSEREILERERIEGEIRLRRELWMAVFGVDPSKLYYRDIFSRRTWSPF